MHMEVKRLLKKIKKRLENIKFHRIARKAKRAEIKGNFKEEGRLECILEENNRCLCCGSEQFFDEKYYKEYGMWKCRECDGQ